jgi:ketosteroid isomerase-like protein
VSSENVDAVRRAFEAFERRDNEATLAAYDPDVEIEAHIDGQVYRGLDGVQEFFRDWLATWDELHSEVEEFIDLGDDVIAMMHVRARGRHSGAPVGRREAHLWTVRDGRLARLRVFATRDEALEAARQAGGEGSD